MAKAVSALDGASHDGYVRVEEAGLQGMITLRGDLSLDAVRAAATTASGTEMPGTREIRAAEDRALAWMSPDELLLMLPYEEAPETVQQLQDALAGTHHLAVNVSDARAMFRLSGGPPVREVAAKLCPVDLAPGRFEPGEFRRTRLAQVAAAIWMPDAQSLQVICFRSVAGYVHDLLCDAAAPGGEVGYLV
ncbi:sarcosine oxidase subunit gamma [Roseovarius salinarum]|uniref:sarcosine oxidase subunit gamma n=1 Tax=Roseovarius salinarum TaxID=1981892 RepID=UPI000C33CB49|nr:sarcosine oxidase subunit gamma family protein [Roseovarius salinarum]